MVHAIVKDVVPFAVHAWGFEPEPAAPVPAAPEPAAPVAEVPAAPEPYVPARPEDPARPVAPVPAAPARKSGPGDPLYELSMQAAGTSTAKATAVRSSTWR
jgi:hypothetical protein